MSEFTVLLESTSPNGDVLAVVEQDADTCCFYLKGDDPDFGVKACWVRNLRAAPEQLDVARMREGYPPMLPRAFCRHPQGAPPLRADELTIIWSEEGDSAALMNETGLLAVIPLWSGRDGFSGYARDCTGESPLCWPLGTPETNDQFERFRRAQEFWRSWDEDPWPAFQTAGCDAITHALGASSNYYAIDGGKWPPKALLRIPLNSETLLTTVGMALRPQPGAELHYEDPSPYRRIELGAIVDSVAGDAAIKGVASYLSAQSCYPWERHTFFGDGHTLPADVFGKLSRGAFPFALFHATPP
ncbi:MAG TPA: hypothetical protein VGE76_03855, partial [Opitutaceae bacterium]